MIYFKISIEAFLNFSGSPLVDSERTSSGRNAVKPLDVFKDDTAMELAASAKNQQGLNESVLKMLSQGKGASIFEVVKPNAVDQETLTAKDNDGFSLLHHAARCDQAKTVNLLLDNGADVDMQGNNGLTALNIAVRYVVSEHLDLTFKLF